MAFNELLTLGSYCQKVTLVAKKFMLEPYLDHRRIVQRFGTKLNFFNVNMRLRVSIKLKARNFCSGNKKSRGRENDCHCPLISFPSAFPSFQENAFRETWNSDSNYLISGTPEWNLESQPIIERRNTISLWKGKQNESSPNICRHYQKSCQINNRSSMPMPP